MAQDGVSPTLDRCGGGRSWLRQLGERIRLHFLPPSCPDDNLIEREVICELHAGVTYNHDQVWIEALQEDVVEHLHRRNRVLERRVVTESRRAVSMPRSDGQPDVTLLMNAAADGDTAAAERLLPLVYDQLRRAAQQRMGSERAGHTLSATALVHEAYLRLVGPRQVPWAGRGHFFAAAAQAMRRILIDHARSSRRLERAGDGQRVNLDFRDLTDLAVHAKPEEIIALEDELRRLERERPRVAQVVQLRFYAGLSVDDTAAALGVSPRTVDLDWAFARAWLFRRLSERDLTDEESPA